MFKFSKRTSFFILVGFLSFVIGLTFLVGCSAKTKEFSANNEVKITLDSGFQQSGSFDGLTGITFHSNTANVQVYKNSKEDFSDFEDLNLTEYAYSESKKTISYDKDNKLCFTEEYKLAKSFTKHYYYKTPNAFYVVGFVYSESGDPRIANWAKTVVTTDELIYDIDESMTNVKRIKLADNDTATMNIGTDFIKAKGHSTPLYQKMRQAGRAELEQCEINQVSKTTSGFKSLSDFALYNAEGTQNRVTGNPNLICQYSYNQFSSTHQYVYYFESNKFYYAIGLVTTSNSTETVTAFDSYAKSLTK